MGEKLRIAFMGTPDFAAYALRALVNSHHEIVCVYSQPPRPKGRGHKVQKSPVHDLADTHGISVFTPKSLKGSDAQEEFAAHDIDIAIVAAYGLLLPPEILDAPKYGCLNIHGSLLPRWRGASPIQRAIWDGDELSGVTIMQMDKGLDTGDMIAKLEIQLGTDMTATKLHDELAEIGADLVLNVLERLAKDGSLSAEKQDEALVTYAHLLKKSDGLVDWTQSALQIDRQVRALNPWPGVWTEIQEKRFKIHVAELGDIDYPNYAGALCDEGLCAGALLNKDGLMLCGRKTVLKLVKIQPEGKKPMDFSSALNGGYIDAKKIF
ncbi:MAG: methionyl-tRNA formyltransferase [Zetaproteobacteria bacterium]|nr:MAG: methionyl-tRNA formyltransferase [Zetaproteobacteria bacterium]